VVEQDPGPVDDRDRVGQLGVLVRVGHRTLERGCGDAVLGELGVLLVLGERGGLLVLPGMDEESTCRNK
jgi:hypothetical protein